MEHFILKDGRFPQSPQVPGDSQEWHQLGDMWAVSQGDRAWPGHGISLPWVFPWLTAPHPNPASSGQEPSLAVGSRTPGEIQDKAWSSRYGHKVHKFQVLSAQIVNFWAGISPLQFWWLHPHSLVCDITRAQEYLCEPPCLKRKGRCSYFSSILRLLKIICGEDRDVSRDCLSFYCLAVKNIDLRSFS